MERSRESHVPNFAERFGRGTARRVEFAAQAQKAETQLAASQLATEGIVVLDPRSDSFLGRLGRAVSPYKKEAALFASVVLAVISTSCGDSGGTGSAESLLAHNPIVEPTQTPTSKLDQRPSHTTYISEDQSLLPGLKGAHERSLVLAREILERIKLDFLIHEVTTVEPRDEIPTAIKKLFGPFAKWAVRRGWVEFYPEGVKMFLNPYFDSEKVGRQTIIHESGHSIDPDLNLYLANFISPDDFSALQKATAKLKDIYWRNYFPDDQKTLSPVEEYYRKVYTSAVGTRFGGTEDLGKTLMLAYLQNPQQFEGWAQEDRDFLKGRIKFLGGEFLAENVANFGLHPLESSQNFPDLTKTSFELGAVLDAVVTQRR